MIKSLWWSFKRNIEGPLATLAAVLILCALIGGPTVLLCWGFNSAPEKVQYFICIGLLVLFIGVVVGIAVRSIVKFCRKVWRDAEAHREWLNSHSNND